MKSSIDAVAKSKPKYIFITSLLIFYSVLTIIDVFHETLSGPNLIDLGNLFLAQCLALFTTMLSILVLQKSKKQLLPWATVSFVSLLFILSSYIIFYNHPRLVTEANGPGTGLYTCMLSERYDTITDLTGEEGNY